MRVSFGPVVVALLLVSIIGMGCAAASSARGEPASPFSSGLSWISSQETPEAQTFYVVWEHWQPDRTQTTVTGEDVTYPNPAAAQAAARQQAKGDAYWIVQASALEQALQGARRIRTPVTPPPR